MQFKRIIFTSVIAVSIAISAALYNAGAAVANVEPAFPNVPNFPCVAGDTIGQCILHEIIKEHSKTDDLDQLVIKTAVFGKAADILVLKENLADYTTPNEGGFARLAPPILEAATGNIEKAIETVNKMAEVGAGPGFAGFAIEPQVQVVWVLLRLKRIDDAVSFILGTQHASFLAKKYKKPREGGMPDPLPMMDDGPVVLTCIALIKEGRKGDAEKLAASITQDSAYLVNMEDKDILKQVALTEDAHKEKLKKLFEPDYYYRSSKGIADFQVVLKWALEGEDAKVLKHIRDAYNESEEARQNPPLEIMHVDHDTSRFTPEGRVYLDSIEKPYRTAADIIRKFVYDRSTNLDLAKQLWPHAMEPCMTGENKRTYSQCLLRLVQ